MENGVSEPGMPGRDVGVEVIDSPSNSPTAQATF